MDEKHIYFSYQRKIFEIYVDCTINYGLKLLILYMNYIAYFSYKIPTGRII